MGNHQSGFNNQNQNWIYQGHTDFRLPGQPKQLFNIKTKEQAEQYRIRFDNRKEFEKQLQIYKRRSGLLSVHLVQTLGIKEDAFSLTDIISTDVNAQIIIEKIPWRLFLQPNNSLSLLEGLYILDGVLDGVQQLCEAFGRSFSIYPQMIGINKKGVVKIWSNSNYGINFPIEYHTSDNNKTMIQMILEIVDNFVRNSQFSQFLKRVGKSSSLSFYKVKFTLDEYAGQMNFKLEEDIGMNIVKRGYHQNQNFDQRNYNSGQAFQKKNTEPGKWYAPQRTLTPRFSSKTIENVPLQAGYNQPPSFRSIINEEHSPRKSSQNSKQNINFVPILQTVKNQSKRSDSIGKNHKKQDSFINQLDQFNSTPRQHLPKHQRTKSSVSLLRRVVTNPSFHTNIIPSSPVIFNPNPTPNQIVIINRNPSQASINPNVVIHVNNDSQKNLDNMKLYKSPTVGNFESTCNSNEYVKVAPLKFTQTKPKVHPKKTNLQKRIERNPSGNIRKGKTRQSCPLETNRSSKSSLKSPISKLQKQPQSRNSKEKMTPSMIPKQKYKHIRYLSGELTISSKTKESERSRGWLPKKKIENPTQLVSLAQSRIQKQQGEQNHNTESVYNQQTGAQATRRKKKLSYYKETTWRPFKPKNRQSQSECQTKRNNENYEHSNQKQFSKDMVKNIRNQLSRIIDSEHQQEDNKKQTVMTIKQRPANVFREESKAMKNASNTCPENFRFHQKHHTVSGFGNEFIKYNLSKEESDNEKVPTGKFIMMNQTQPSFNRERKRNRKVSKLAQQEEEEHEFSLDYTYETEVKGHNVVIKNVQSPKLMKPIQNQNTGISSQRLR